MNSLKISTKVVITLLISIIGMSIISLSSYFGISKIGKELVEIADYQMPINKSVIELEKDILKEEILTYELLVASKDIKSDRFKKVVKDIHNLEEITDKAIKKTEELVSKAINHAQTKEAKDQYKHFLEELIVLEKEQKQFKKDIQHCIEDILKGDMKKFEKDKKELISNLKLMDKNITILLNEMTELLENSTHQAEKDERKVLLIIEIISVIVLIASIISAFLLIKFFNKSITEFQRGLKGFFKYLNNETKEVTPLKDSNKDEIGEMAKAVNSYILKTQKALEEDKALIENVKKIVEDVKNGCIRSKIEASTSNKSLYELKSSFNEMISTLQVNVGNNTNVILEVLGKLSSNNFENEIPNAQGKIEKSINKVIELINKMLLDNKINGLTLDESAKQLLQNVNKLNTSSNEAAASLEETAAALEQITSAVALTSNKTSQMSDLASTVISSSQTGEELASRTTSSMDEINEQVSAINDAIGIIDQISFQTNILSLNAAVESATAGEAGKGFAVVAQEVRNLANRSSEAAKEIKDLVERASIKANEGKEISDEMIIGYKNLSDNINQTTELINDITNASKEQQAGLEQVNDAINLLDRKTQENANVATQTKEISDYTSSLSKDILIDVDNKNFKGKDSAKSKRIEIDYLPQEKKPKESLTSNQNQILPSSQSTEDDQWESF